MSQSKIRTRVRVLQSSEDWMMELEHDAQQFQAVLSRIDELAAKAMTSVVRHQYIDAGMRLGEIQEGIQLLCTLAGIKVETHVPTT